MISQRHSPLQISYLYKNRTQFSTDTPGYRGERFFWTKKRETVVINTIRATNHAMVERFSFLFSFHGLKRKYVPNIFIITNDTGLNWQRKLWYYLPRLPTHGPLKALKIVMVGIMTWISLWNSLTNSFSPTWSLEISPYLSLFGFVQYHVTFWAIDEHWDNTMIIIILSSFDSTCVWPASPMALLWRDDSILNKHNDAVVHVFVAMASMQFGAKYMQNKIISNWYEDAKFHYRYCLLLPSLT